MKSHSKEPTKREEFLEEGKNKICNDRAKEYGDALETHQDIADVWMPIIRNALSRYGRILPAHVSIMMSMLKNIRASKNLLHTDSWVDGCGYSALGGELSQRMKDEIIQLEKKNES